MSCKNLTLVLFTEGQAFHWYTKCIIISLVRFNELWLADTYATYAVLENAFLELPNISHVINIGQATVKHFSGDLMLVVSDRMA